MKIILILNLWIVLSNISIESFEVYNKLTVNNDLSAYIDNLEKVLQRKNFISKNFQKVKDEFNDFISILVKNNYYKTNETDDIKFNLSDEYFSIFKNKIAGKEIEISKLDIKKKVLDFHNIKYNLIDNIIEWGSKDLKLQYDIKSEIINIYNKKKLFFEYIILKNKMIVHDSQKKEYDNIESEWNKNTLFKSHTINYEDFFTVKFINKSIVQIKNKNQTILFLDIKKKNIIKFVSNKDINLIINYEKKEEEKASVNFDIIYNKILLSKYKINYKNSYIELFNKNDKLVFKANDNDFYKFKTNNVEIYHKNENIKYISSNMDIVYNLLTNDYVINFEEVYLVSGLKLGKFLVEFNDHDYPFWTIYQYTGDAECRARSAIFGFNKNDNGDYDLNYVQESDHYSYYNKEKKNYVIYIKDRNKLSGEDENTKNTDNKNYEYILNFITKKNLDNIENKINNNNKLFEEMKKIYY